VACNEEFQLLGLHGQEWLCYQASFRANWNWRAS
jgi:hypothetical protein